jgi:hypothetical protein
MHGQDSTRRDREQPAGWVACTVHPRQGRCRAGQPGQGRGSRHAVCDATHAEDPVRGARARGDPGRGRGRTAGNAMRAGSGKAGGVVDRRARGLTDADRACACRAGAEMHARGSPARPLDRARVPPRGSLARVGSRAGIGAGMLHAGRAACGKARGHAASGCPGVREGPRPCSARAARRARRPEAMQRAVARRVRRPEAMQRVGRVAHRKGSGDAAGGSPGAPEG